MSVSYFIPANLSLYFTANKKSSKGVGFTINQGILAKIDFRTEIKPSTLNQISPKFSVFFNSKPTRIASVDNILEIFRQKFGISDNFKINLTSNLPLGSGFGLSAASAFAVGLCLNEWFNLNLDRLEIAKLSHRSEVESKTGLGDVTNQFFSGVVAKFSASSKFKGLKLNVDQKKIYFQVFGSKNTDKILNQEDLVKKINRSGNKIMAKFRQLVTDDLISQIRLTDLLDLSFEFAKNSGLIELSPVALEKILEIKKNGGAATMLIIGDGLISSIPFEGAEVAEIV